MFGGPPNTSVLKAYTGAPFTPPQMVLGGFWKTRVLSENEEGVSFITTETHRSFRFHDSPFLVSVRRARIPRVSNPIGFRVTFIEPLEKPIRSPWIPWDAHVEKLPCCHFHGPVRPVFNCKPPSVEFQSPGSRPIDSLSQWLNGLNFLGLHI